MIGKLRGLWNRYRWSRSAEANAGRAPLDIVLSGFEAPASLRALVPNGSEPAGGSGAPGETNFIICYVPRSGSHHLADLLQSTGLAGKPADYLHLALRAVASEREVLVKQTGVLPLVDAEAAYGTHNVNDYLRRIARETRSHNGVFGLRADLEDAAILMRRGLFLHPAWNWKYVYLTRRDRVQQAISFAIAAKSGAWSSGTPGTAVELDEGVVAAHLLRLEEVAARFECAFSLFGVEPLRIAYEDLDAQPRAVVANVLNHLGVAVDAAELSIASTLEKQRNDTNARWTERLRATVGTGSSH